MSKLNLEKDKISKLFFSYAIPSAIGMIVMSIYMIIDGIFVGNFVGEEALAAINLAFPIFMIFIGLLDMIGIGGSVFTSIKLGEGDVKKAKETFSFTLCVNLCISVIIFFLIFVLAEPLFKLVGAEKELLVYAVQYIRIFCIFGPLMMLFYMLDSFVRVDGSPNFSMILGIISSGLNIILDYILIVVLGYGLVGAGIATGISASFAGIVALGYFFSKKSKLKVVKPIGSFKLFKEMVYNGSSEFLAQISSSIANIAINFVILKQLGTLGITAISIVMYINSVVGGVTFGIADSISSIISFNLGARQIERVKQVLKIAFMTTFGIGVLAYILVLFNQEFLVSIFVDNASEDLYNLTILASKIIFISCFFLWFNMVSTSYFTAIKNAKISIIIAMSRSLIFILLGLAIFPLIMPKIGVWIVIPFAELCTLFVSIHYIKKSDLEKVCKELDLKKELEIQE